MLNKAALLMAVKKTDKVIQVACSGATTWFLTKSGKLYGCGYGKNGQQGNGSSGDTVKVTTFTKRADNVAQVACSGGDDYNYQTTWYVTKSGELYGCGYGKYGQQGSGSTSNVTSFTKRP